MDPSIRLSFSGMFGFAAIAIGLLGGVFYSWAHVAKAKGPLERNYAIRSSLVLWAITLLFLGLIPLLPSVYVYINLCLIVFLIPALVYKIIVKTQIIREYELRKRQPGLEKSETP